ncbi:hypothetical protein L9F63_013828, partial [Diploptera punctata]
MAWIGIRVGIGKILAGPPTGNGRSLLKVNVERIFPIHSAGISGSGMRDKTKTRPKPYPYMTKPYNLLRAWFLDSTTYRFDENTKIIVVEGPVAAGKTVFAKNLAQELDMLHMPEVTMDNLYINNYGFDMRKLDPQLPKNTRSYDEKDFCKDPNHRSAARFQVLKYKLRFEQYVDALAHLMNTGQGVVLERCAYSDYVFAETMFKSGYISKGARDVYYDIRNNTLGELMRPHLVIYLDVPVPIVQQRVKQRNLPYEVNSKVYSTEYLNTMEYFYKQRYLNEISTHAELLVYDWSEHGDVEVVVEDIERIDFDSYDKNDSKMHDWRLPGEWDWNTARMDYTEKDGLMMNFLVPRFDVPELVYDAHESYEFRKVWYNAPGMNFGAYLHHYLKM